MSDERVDTTMDDDLVGQARLHARERREAAENLLAKARLIWGRTPPGLLTGEVEPGEGVEVFCGRCANAPVLGRFIMGYRAPDIESPDPPSGEPQIIPWPNLVLIGNDVAPVGLNCADIRDMEKFASYWIDSELPPAQNMRLVGDPVPDAIAVDNDYGPGTYGLDWDRSLMERERDGGQLREQYVIQCLSCGAPPVVARDELFGRVIQQLVEGGYRRIPLGALHKLLTLPDLKRETRPPSK